jgi:large subunit ribosomal protein L13|uniref:50S ribosomal protein L13 n=1 Tax=Ochromonas sp. CCMP1393 TaxID=420556 RepID=A0A0D3MKZ6_9STRA|nr:50S ribosomal protein L13 [Ochromonas sp. CCMP1393]
MKTIFPKKEYHVPKWFVIDANEKTLGRLATEASKLLRGKETTFFTPGVDQGNFVVILNADKIKVSGKKELQKLYYRNSQRPGGLKIESFQKLKDRIPSRILERAIWGMLPKGVLGREYYRRLYIYSNSEIKYKKTKDGNSKTINLASANEHNWIEVNLENK